MINDALTLHASVSPSNATTQDLIWTSSDPSVAGVDSCGVVYALAEGSVTITVKSFDGGYTAACTIHVGKIPVSGITLSRTEMRLTPYSASPVTATVLPENASCPGVTWTSDDPSVATVVWNWDEIVIEGTGAGTTTIRATADGQTATCAVTVTIDVLSVSLNKTSMTLEPGQSDDLTATISPDNATYKTIS